VPFFPRFYDVSVMPAPRLTVLIADDSALYRQMLQNVLQRIPNVEIVGTAVDGVDAVARVLELRPDVITLDIQMPKLDGLGVLRQLRARGSRTKAIMVSSLTLDGAPATVEALMEGAFDVIPKPAGADPHVARASIHEALIEKLAAIVDSGGPAASGAAAARRLAAGCATAAIDAIAIGTSTGGPCALRGVIPLLPGDLPVPVLVVQHMPAGFTTSLANRLNELSPLRVREAAHGDVVETGNVFVAAGGWHLTVERKQAGVRCVLDAGPARHGCRPSFDALLEAMVALYGGKILAVVMTGMGQDGLAGCRAVKQAGGAVITQAAEGCAVYGMPKAVAEAGLTDAILPVDTIAEAITAYTRSRRV
jgi:two-component system, chemotaxis family, protein-glutamate methylesterase/glutaminase